MQECSAVWVPVPLHRLPVAVTLPVASLSLAPQVEGANTDKIPHLYHYNKMLRTLSSFRTLRSSVVASSSTVPVSVVGLKTILYLSYACANKNLQTPDFHPHFILLMCSALQSNSSHSLQECQQRFITRTVMKHLCLRPVSYRFDEASEA